MRKIIETCTPDSAPGHADLSARIHASVEGLKTRLLQRYEENFRGRIDQVRAAIEIAEAVAWCTPFPHLFLPDLAEQQIALLADDGSKPASTYAFAA